MRKLVIVNGPNNNFYGIRNKGQYGNQLYADLRLRHFRAMGKGHLSITSRAYILKRRKVDARFRWY